jgi:hypothetical protein
MKLVQFTIFGIILQGVFLVAFILISRTTYADLGKPFVICLACLSVAFLLWRGVRNASGQTYCVCFPSFLQLDISSHFIWSA